MSVLEDWGMLAVKTGEIGMKKVLMLCDHLLEE
jgi:hypothetical protein